MNYFLIAAPTVCCGWARGQAPAAPSAPAQTETLMEARERKARNQINVEPHKDWKGWLDNNFPDASAAWPAAALGAFTAVAQRGRWDYVGKGNIDRDGAPTGLLIRFKDKPLKGYLILDRLIVTKWLDGKWTELLNLDAGDGLAVGGVKPGAMQSPQFHGYHLRLFAGDPDDASNPGMWISVKAGRVPKAVEIVVAFGWCPDSSRFVSPFSSHATTKALSELFSTTDTPVPIVS